MGATPADRGALKQALLRLGWPAADEAGYSDGAALDDVGLTCALRNYQDDAVATWWANGSPAGGNGVLVLPCGSGKTVIGLASLARAGAHTLVLTTSILAARQWISELFEKTDIDPDLVGEYSGERKQVRPITVATYQVVTWRDTTVPADADLAVVHPHLGLFDQQEWGLVIYDEVHLLPAPVFRVTARIQAVRRLGLTATLVREDGREGDVFSLIGPKRYDAPWRELEAQGWIAPATCTEVRVELHRGPNGMTVRRPRARGQRYRRGGDLPVPSCAVLERTRWQRHRGEPGPGHRPVPRAARTRSRERLGRAG
ncbi:MAG: DEAD/DEAH box helicase [Acidimicrobiia bacterium]|nr:DEAD/DEAH box helicase [Acidimicrobiia bacterium]